MHEQRTPGRDGVLVAHGYGLKVYVNHGHLIVEDGVGRDRRAARINRVTGRLKRLVVLGVTGYVTLDALAWIREVGAAFTQINRDGQIVVTSTAAGPNLPKLRRAQAFAASDATGLHIARWLLSEKLAGQARIATELPDGQAAASDISAAGVEVKEVVTIDAAISAEARAASAYWEAWSTLPMPFGRRDREQVPQHWLTVGSRRSVLTRSNRLAATPANAILNYLYALLETETILALAAVGLDPGLGIFHTDKPARASMALDVMEACRPVVDAYVLAMLTQRTLSARDFHETPRGTCRLRREFAGQLAETTTVWASHIAPVCEHVAQDLAHAADTPSATPLTQGNRSAAWGSRRTRPAAARIATPRLPDRCRDCGGELPTRRHRYCHACREQKRTEASHRGREQAARVLGQLRAEARDPAHGGQAGQARAAKNAAHQRALREWDSEHGTDADPTEFAASVAPKLRGVPLSELTTATGLSEHYCSLIRLGKRVPHHRHWATFERVASRQ